MYDARTSPGFGEHIARVFEERGASPFVAARFARLPVAAQIAAIPYIEAGDVELRELISTLKERVS